MCDNPYNLIVEESFIWSNIGFNRLRNFRLLLFKYPALSLYLLEALSPPLNRLSIKHRLGVLSRTSHRFSSILQVDYALLNLRILFKVSALHARPRSSHELLDRDLICLNLLQIDIEEFFEVKALLGRLLSFLFLNMLLENHCRCFWRSGRTSVDFSLMLLHLLIGQGFSLLAANIEMILSIQFMIDLTKALLTLCGKVLTRKVEELHLLL